MRKSTSGFTVIELIVIIVVLGIIAAIVIVSYAGFQKATLNEQRRTELLGWKTSFEKYKAANGQYPIMADGGYCLGSGFPDGKCRDYKSTTNVYSELDSTTLMSALSPYDPPVQGTRVPVESASGGATVGPYAIYNSTTIYLYTALASIDEDDCPDDTVSSWNNGVDRMVCRFELSR